MNLHEDELVQTSIDAVIVDTSELGAYGTGNYQSALSPDWKNSFLCARD